MELLEILQKKYSGNYRIFGYEDNNKKILVNLDLTGDIKFNFKDDASIDALGIISPYISANLGQVSFYSQLDVWTQYRSDTTWRIHDYTPYRGQTFNIIGGDGDSSNFRALDDFRGGISAQSKNARLDIAVDNLTAGPAVYNHLILNALDKPVFYTRFMLDFKKIQYYQIFGVLRELKYYNKYLYYHRLQFPFFENRFTLGLSASIVSGSTADDYTMFVPHSQHLLPSHLEKERRIEPVYTIPFIPYVFSEHYLGDLDNKQISMDFELKFPKLARWYAEFMLDDATAPHTILNDSWNNKWSLTVGTQWFPVIIDKNAVFGLEYCRVEPWVYTHFYGVATNYEHYGKCFGAELGPNSAQIRGLAQYYFSQKHGLQLELIHNRYNRNVRGGNAGDVFLYPDFEDSYAISYPDYDFTPDSETKEFLGENYTKNYEISLSYLLKQFGRYEMKTGICYNNEIGVGLKLWGGWRF
jgi:hypothetical protein